jgi:radical SAM superfamily enzyme YgiQ (UPF0313 family)
VVTTPSKSTRVALVRPSWEFPVNPDEAYIHNRQFAPLSLALAAAMLRERGIQVRIVDAHALRLRPEEVATRVRDCDKVFVTSSGLDRWECPNTDIEPFLATTRALAGQVPELYACGVHPTVRPRAVLEELEVDAAILGEPEQAIVEIAEGRPLSEVQGLVLRRDGELTFTAPRERLLDLDALPLPAFDLLPMDRYGHVIMGPHSVMLEASRGCPYKCTTCLQVMFGPRYRKKSGATLVREVQAAVEQHGARNITFIDMEFCLNREAVEQLCEFLAEKRYDLQWCCSTRADAVDAALLGQMKAGGCSLIHYGVESGDQGMVDHINKRLELDKVEQAVRLTQQAGMEALAFFMFGLPGETREQMEQTKRFARRLNPDYVSYHIFTPYPCTAAFEEIGAPDEPLMPTSAGQHDEAELRRFVRRAMLDFYLRPGFALRYARNVWRRGLLNQAKLFWRYMRG